MSDRAEIAIAVLSLAAAGLVILAPMLGRAELARAADVAMASAALCGVAAFALAGVHSLRAARRRSPSPAPAAERRDQP